jgi:hypothetical protein
MQNKIDISREYSTTIHPVRQHPNSKPKPARQIHYIIRVNHRFDRSQLGHIVTIDVVQGRIVEGIVAVQCYIRYILALCDSEFTNAFGTLTYGVMEGVVFGRQSPRVINVQWQKSSATNRRIRSVGSVVCKDCWLKWFESVRNECC